MSTISNIQQIPNRYNFSMEKPTQSMDKKVLIEQSTEGLKLFIQECDKIHQIKKHLIEGIPKIDLVPREFFESCIVQLISSTDGYSVKFFLPLRGGVRGNRAEMFAELGRGVGFKLNFTKAPVSVQDVLTKAMEYADRHPEVDGCSVSYTSGSGIGFNPEWDIELYTGSTRVWRDNGSTTMFGIGKKVSEDCVMF